jgi:ubiquinone/menaquinone biosynthesis C-methylase UbiE
MIKQLKNTQGSFNLSKKVIHKREPFPNLYESLEKYYRYGEDWITRYLHRQRVEFLAEIIACCSTKAKNALDIGCGSGIYTVLMARQNLLTIGIDLSKEATLAVKEWVEELGVQNYVNLINCSAEFLPLKDTTFDLIVCSELIEHLDIPEHGLNEISRVLNCIGTAILTLPNLVSYYWMRFNFAYSLFKFLGNEQNILVERHTNFPFWRTLALVKKSGLLVTLVTSLNIIPQPFSIWKNLIENHTGFIKLFKRLEIMLAMKKTPLSFLGSSLVVLARRIER